MKPIIIICLICFAFVIPTKKQIIYNAKFIEENCIYIPAGSYNLGPSDQDVPIAHTQKSRVVSVKSFYMWKTEITNEFYKQFVFETKWKGDSNAYKSTLPDTAVWRDKFAYNEPYVEYYFRHPAYGQYPLVGINYNQCLKFCEWLTEKYNTDPKRKFKKVKFDLPGEEQWIWAAKGGLEFASFPWKGPYMQNSKAQWKANFAVMDQSGIVRLEFDVPSVYGGTYKQTYNVAGASGYNVEFGSKLNYSADITSPVISYWPNEYGLYNMSGNVEEFIKEKGITKGGSWRDTGYYLQIDSKEEYSDSTQTSSERGFRIIMNVLEEFKK